jgi:hypothetical protein
MTFRPQRFLLGGRFPHRRGFAGRTALLHDLDNREAMAIKLAFILIPRSSAAGSRVSNPDSRPTDHSCHRSETLIIVPLNLSEWPDSACEDVPGGLPESADGEALNGHFQFAYFSEHGLDLLPNGLLDGLPQHAHPVVQDGEDFHYLQILRLFPGLGGSSDLGKAW